MKICKTCLLNKKLNDFYSKPSGKGGLDANCKTCIYNKSKVRKQSNPAKHYDINKAWRQKNPDKYKDGQLKIKFGITLEIYNQMLLTQHKSCAICKKHESEFDQKFAVDHCHETGKIRGLLCGACNKGLGYFKDNTEFLKGAIIYLEGGLCTLKN